MSSEINQSNIRTINIQGIEYAFVGIIENDMNARGMLVELSWLEENDLMPGAYVVLDGENEYLIEKINELKYGTESHRKISIDMVEFYPM